MYEVKIFDGHGNLKNVLSREYVQNSAHKQFMAREGYCKFKLLTREFVCIECKSGFKSRAWAPLSCPGCRKTRENKQNRLVYRGLRKPTMGPNKGKLIKKNLRTIDWEPLMLHVEKYLKKFKRPVSLAQIANHFHKENKNHSLRSIKSSIVTAFRREKEYNITRILRISKISYGHYQYI